MKNITKTIAAIAFATGAMFAANNAYAADGYKSPDVKYAKPCVADARQKAQLMANTYQEMNQLDYEAELKLVDPTFPAAFRNPVRKEQFVHPIEFKVLFVRGFETRIRVMYANSSATDPNMCVFQGIEFLDLTDAN